MSEAINLIGSKLNGRLMRCLYILGPGLLFAANSIGTSHLVQSTRAGADYGLALMGFILLSNAVKYPAFRFGSDYGVATGQSLIESYFKQGKWAVLVYILEVTVTMFISLAAVALVSAGLVNFVLPWQLSDVGLACLLMGVGAIILVSGRYHMLERVIKVLVALFTILVVVSVVLTAPGVDWQLEEVFPPAVYDGQDILFLIALCGWMPTAIGVSVWQSLWVCAKSKELGRAVTISEARFDFNLGYIIIVLLALCFMTMGAALMYRENIEIANTSSSFGAQLINLFTTSIGQWAYPIISIAAIAVMYSTVLTMMDACPRAVGAVIDRWKKDVRNNQGTEIAGKVLEGTRFYTGLIVLEVIGASLILLLLMRSFGVFIDFATSIAFLTAPLLAYMNHHAITNSEIPKEIQPSVAMRIWSLTGVVTMSAVALCYVYYILLS